MNMNHHIKKLRDGIYNGVIRGSGIRFIQLINEEKFSCWEFFFLLFCVSVLLLFVFSLCFVVSSPCYCHRSPDSFSPGSNIGPFWILCHSVATNSPVLHFLS